MNVTSENGFTQSVLKILFFRRKIGGIHKDDDENGEDGKMKVMMMRMEEGRMRDETPKSN